MLNKEDMHKQNYKMGNITVRGIYLAILILVLTAVVSCSVKSPISRTGSVMTKGLFIQSKHANVELPYVESGKTNKDNVVSESITYMHEDNTLTVKDSLQTKATNLNEVQRLSEVVIVAKSRFTPEHKGRINVDFVIRVPKEILSPKWRITLKPIIFHNDSIVYLKEVILKGKDFYEKQKNDYKAYDDFLKSIVTKSEYDSVFLDRKGIAKDIRGRQDFYYNKYYSDWKKQKDLQDNIDAWEKKEAEFSAMETAHRDKVYHKYARKALTETIEKYSQGKDTVGIYNHYMQQYNKEAKELSLFWRKRIEAHRKKEPKLRAQKNMEEALDKVSNYIITKNDSVRIARHRYMFEDIVENELKEKRKDEVFKQMVPYPYEQNTQLDSVITTNKDFVYYYKQDYPVSIGLKQIRISMQGKVNAIDYSSYTMGNIDTLAYFISSLSQLADTTLMYKVTKLNRDVYNVLTSYVKFPPKKFKLDVDYKDNKDQLKKIMDTYYAFTSKGVYALDSAIIKVSSSLEGTFDDNIELTQKRSEEIKAYIRRTLGGELDVNSVFKAQYISEDWNTLAREIKRRKDIKNKDAILNMLGNAINPDQSEEEIKRLYKSDFAIIKDSIYPLLEKVEIELNMHRTDMTDKVEVRREYLTGYDEGVRLLLERDYWKALDILGNYPDFNAALCLTCLGYNAKAYELLLTLPKTANIEYLLSILALRLNKEDEAVEYLLDAIKHDPSKVYRIPLDHEVSGLVEKRQLKSRIDELLVVSADSEVEATSATKK